MAIVCWNYLTIEGNKATIRRIYEFVKSEESVFDFEKIIPMPEDIYRGSIGAKEKDLYGENNWYDWSSALSFDVTTAVSVAFENGAQIFYDSRTQKIIADAVMREVRKGLSQIK